MAERYDHRHDRAKPIERLVTIGPGTLGAFVLAYLGDLQLRNYSRHTIRAARNPAAKLELPRVEKRLPRGILSVEEAEAVLAQPDVDTPRGLRDRAILETLYATGVRRQELAALAVDDLDLRSAVVFVREGKEKKDRLLPLSERAAAWLLKYLEEARPRLIRKRNPGKLFLGRWGEPLGEMYLGKLVRTYVLAAGLGKEGSCHMFRHTLATLMLEGGADIRYVQQMLGHASITSTEIYTHVALRKLREVHAASHPGAKLSHRQRRELGELPPDPRQQLLSSLAAEAAAEELAGAGDAHDDPSDLDL